MNFDPAVGIFLNGLIAVLLLATIATGLFLNRRIERLRRSARDINTAVGGFDKATARARAGIETLRKTLAESGEQLQDQINTARSLREDLKQMAIAGGRVNAIAGGPAPSALADTAPRKMKKPLLNAEPKSLPRAEPPWAQVGAELGAEEVVSPMARAQALRQVVAAKAAQPKVAVASGKAPAPKTFSGPSRPMGNALNRKNAAAAMAASATSEASEVERELRELLRNVR